MTGIREFYAILARRLNMLTVVRCRLGWRDDIIPALNYKERRNDLACRPLRGENRERTAVQAPRNSRGLTRNQYEPRATPYPGLKRAVYAS